MRVIIIGNSGSGKSTFAKSLAGFHQIPHLDLDSLAWNERKPTKRRSFSESSRLIDQFIGATKHWVIEGCYSDLVDYVTERSTHLYFLNLPIEECVANCENRPWEPHKYKSKTEQDDNLAMLTEWVRGYFGRDDEFSYQSHKDIFDAYAGQKFEIASNQQAEQVIAGNPQEAQ